jgi:hypothetical protein
MDFSDPEAASTISEGAAVCFCGKDPDSLINGMKDSLWPYCPFPRCKRACCKSAKTVYTARVNKTMAAPVNRESFFTFTTDFGDEPGRTFEALSNPL